MLQATLGTSAFRSLFLRSDSVPIQHYIGIEILGSNIYLNIKQIVKAISVKVKCFGRISRNKVRFQHPNHQLFL